MSTTMQQGRLAGKIAVITGTAGGQGREAAVRFAAEGATVYGCDVNSDAAAETVDLVTATGGIMNSVHPLDLTDEDAVRSWIDGIGAAHGRIDILYANAGLATFAPIPEITFEDWRFVMAHEVDLVFLPVKHAWKYLAQAANASVILVGSTAGVTGSVTNTRLAHTASKGAVVAMTKQLAAEGAAHHIRANCISPGMIRTPQSESTLLSDDHPMRKIASAIPLGRLGTAADVVNYAVFLASDEAGYVTGTNLMIDGGWSAVLPG
ncbi:SDR family NAD(P)-dependent oxidoreductase [Rhodococcus opacus]|uniref:SDR family NAD(P)-dependent oxidoreductase n=1 Tax=Rhodococcus opacus TaxID=37919 RepID=A0AAX3Y8L5_RHOOP|nr:SDR family NAD(P)-dependent oxidoreductase [Rhodococcus opacus]MCZ4589981.1 SDR family NAD(P)-dependent oxidoreductase [Rhodococcus opacus]WLF44506.1 SDR family NAD(P)-dependent oxidoreductase [Rhodococcus opacus]